MTILPSLLVLLTEGWQQDKHALSVLMGDEERVGGSDMCLMSSRGNENADYSVH